MLKSRVQGLLAVLVALVWSSSIQTALPQASPRTPATIKEAQELNKQWWNKNPWDTELMLDPNRSLDAMIQEGRARSQTNISLELMQREQKRQIGLQYTTNGVKDRSKLPLNAAHTIWEQPPERPNNIVFWTGTILIGLAAAWRFSRRQRPAPTAKSAAH
jgi:hypothetical protein